jgi:hypothetical protein
MNRDKRSTLKKGLVFYFIFYRYQYSYILGRNDKKCNLYE